MQRSLALALVVSLSAQAFANECSAGYTYKADLTDLLCKSDATTAASCNANCCTKDTKTCGGLGATCAGDKYPFPDGATQAVKDAWSAKAATQKDMGTQCCTAKAKCSSAAFSCPAGSKKTTDAALECTSDAASCAKTPQCCVSNDKTCQGQKTGNKCGGACACDAAAAGKSAPAEGTDDAWKNTVTDGATLADFKAKCCTRTLPTCESDAYQCPPGFERDTTEKGRFCNGFDAAAACGQTTAPGWGDVTIGGVKVGDNGAKDGMCCKAVARACKTLVSLPNNNADKVTCAADRYTPSSLDGVVAPAGKGSDVCCTAKATCSMVAACPSGYKKKINSDATLCAGDIASCTEAANIATCCEADTSKCGGLFDLSCKTGYFSERSQAAWNDPKIYTQARKDAWNNKPANETTKNDACCTKQAACSNTSTTTPAPVAATTTPAPALKYSAHQIATQREGNHPAMNIVWLAVGGVMGMAVLAVAHGLRSRTAVEDSREVDNLLADEMSSIE